MKKPEHKHDYAQAGIAAMIQGGNPNYLGMLDANDDLKEQEGISKFICIDSYSEFINPDCMFLVGRIGTGKTAMLLKLMKDIEEKVNKNYRLGELIETQRYAVKISRIIRLTELSRLSYAEQEDYVRELWEKTLNAVAMLRLYQSFSASSPDRVEKIGQFLKMNRMVDDIDDRPLKMKLMDLLDAFSHIDNAAIQGASTAIQTFVYDSDGYSAALREMNRLLNREGGLVVLIDSGDRYEYNDSITLAVLNGLIKACKDINRSERGLFIKLALPSELIPKLTSVNLEKLSSKMVYIRWSQKDLKTMIAVRLYKYINNISGCVETEEAIKFFDQYYDKFCDTKYNCRFPTFSYCMSYTQKKPRQMIAIFNAWLHLEKIDKRKGRMDLLNDAISLDIVTRIQGAMNIYSAINPYMYDMFQRTFASKKYCFSESEFDVWLKACSRTRGDLDAYDLKKYFISSGLVGVMVSLHDIPTGHTTLQNQSDMRIKEVLFEYQQKEGLPYNTASRFCLHPMCFEALNIEYDRNTLVYPKPLEFEGEYVPWKDE